MIGRIRYSRKKGKGELTMSQMGPLTILSAELYEPKGLSRRRLLRRLARLERCLAGRGVGRVILPEDFAYGEALTRLRPVETLPFYRAVADVLARGALEGMGVPENMGRVALSAPWLCPELKGAAEQLCPRVRELVIDVPEEGGGFAQWLHGRYGLPVTPTDVKAHVTVAFGPTERSGDGRTLRLYGRKADLDGLTLSAPELALPADCGQPALALLWEAGCLTREGLKVLDSTTISGQTLAKDGALWYNY